MDKFLKRKSMVAQDSIDSPKTVSKRTRVDVNNLPSDPGLREKILSYHPNDRDDVRRSYLQKGPCQPADHNFPQRDIGGLMRRFSPSWFEDYKNWLEYSVQKDAIFCLPCYLFRPDNGKRAGGDAFVMEGFTSWNKVDRLRTHVGGVNSAHNQAVKQCEVLMRQKQHIQSVFCKQTEQAKIEYRTRLNAILNCLKYLLHQGLPTRGHDESEDSSNKGNFLELLRFLADNNENINEAVYVKAPKHNKLTHADIQRDIVNAAASETTLAIIKDLDKEYFSILVDESRDVSVKEQMAIVLRYVDKMGVVTERFLGIVHVADTTALTLKVAIESIFCKHGLSMSRIRGQGYDGASNMQGAFNGLKSLILRENSSAFYVHCFAHQLQLTLVAVAKNHIDIEELFRLIAIIVNVVGGSSKRRDILRDTQVARVAEALECGELESGQGMNQETSVKRAGDTRWGSHYGSIMNLILMFSSVIDVLEVVKDGATHLEQRSEARSVMDMAQSFEFAFCLHLMKHILGITNDLSLALQRKDQDIVNAMKLVKVCKERLQGMRDGQWDLLFSEVSSFCNNHGIDIPSMDDKFVARGKSRRKAPEISNLHHYRVDLFYRVIDLQLQELNNRFTEVNSELLVCGACLNPTNSFFAFDKQMLIHLAELYPCDFSAIDLMALDSQLENYIVDVRSSKEFCEVKGVADLAEKLVETKKDLTYPLVYLLVKLTLILPVATATVERAFSAMKIIKNRLRNRMGDQLMNDCLVTYIESDIFRSIDNELIMQRFQNMKTRRGQL